MRQATHHRCQEERLDHDRGGGIDIHFPSPDEAS